MFNNITTQLNNNSPASGILKKSHPISKIEVASNRSNKVSFGYLHDTRQYKDKITIIQIMPCTEDRVIVEYYFDKDMEEYEKEMEEYEKKTQELCNDVTSQIRLEVVEYQKRVGFFPKEIILNEKIAKELKIDLTKHTTFMGLNLKIEKLENDLEFILTSGEYEHNS